MKKRFVSAIGRTIKLEQDVDKIVRISQLDISSLIEAGLISLAKQPGERKDNLLQEAIRITEDRISYYTSCLEELKNIKNTAPITNTSEHAIKEPVPAPKKFYNLEESLLVRDARNDEEILVSRPQYERNKDIYKLVVVDAEA